MRLAAISIVKFKRQAKHPMQDTGRNPTEKSALLPLPQRFITNPVSDNYHCQIKFTQYNKKATTVTVHCLSPYWL